MGSPQMTVEQAKSLAKAGYTVYNPQPAYAPGTIIGAGSYVVPPEQQKETLVPVQKESGNVYLVPGVALPPEVKTETVSQISFNEPMAAQYPAGHRTEAERQAEIQASAYRIPYGAPSTQRESLAPPPIPRPLPQQESLFLSPYDINRPVPETGKPVPEMVRVESPKIFEVPKGSLSKRYGEGWEGATGFLKENNTVTPIIFFERGGKLSEDYILTHELTHATDPFRYKNESITYGFAETKNLKYFGEIKPVNATQRFTDMNVTQEYELIPTTGGMLFGFDTKKLVEATKGGDKPIFERIKEHPLFTYKPPKETQSITKEDIYDFSNKTIGFVMGLPKKVSETIKEIPIYKEQASAVITKYFELGKKEKERGATYLSKKFEESKNFLAGKKEVIIAELKTIPERIKELPKLHSAVIATQERQRDIIKGSIPAIKEFASENIPKTIGITTTFVSEEAPKIRDKVVVGTEKAKSFFEETRIGRGGLAGETVKYFKENIKQTEPRQPFGSKIEDYPLLYTIKEIKEHPLEAAMVGTYFVGGVAYRAAALAYPTVETAGTAYFSYQIGKSVVTEGVKETAKGLATPEGIAFALGAGTVKKGERVKVETKPVIGSVVMEEPVIKEGFTLSRGKGEFVGGIKRGGILSTERVISGPMEVAAVTKDKAGYAIVSGVGDVVETKKFMGIEYSKKVIQRDVPVSGVANIVGMEKQFDFIITDKGVFQPMALVDKKSGVVTFGYEPASLSTASAEVGRVTSEGRTGDYFAAKKNLGEVTRTYSDFEYTRTEKPFNKGNVQISIVPKEFLKKEYPYHPNAQGVYEPWNTPSRGEVHDIFIQKGAGGTSGYTKEKMVFKEVLAHELIHIKYPKSTEFETDMIAKTKGLSPLLSKIEKEKNFRYGRSGTKYETEDISSEHLKFDKQIFEDWKQTQKEITYKKTGVTGAARLDTGELVDTYTKIYSPIGEKTIELKTETQGTKVKQALNIEAKTMPAIVVDVGMPIATSVKKSVPAPQGSVFGMFPTSKEKTGSIQGVVSEPQVDKQTKTIGFNIPISPKEMEKIGVGLQPRIFEKQKKIQSTIHPQKIIQREIQTPFSIPDIRQKQTPALIPDVGLIQLQVPGEQPRQKQRQEQIPIQPEKPKEVQRLRPMLPLSFKQQVSPKRSVGPKPAFKKPLRRPLSPKFDIITGFFEQQKTLFRPTRLAAPRGKRVSKAYGRAVMGYTPRFSFPTAGQLKTGFKRRLK